MTSEQQDHFEIDSEVFWREIESKFAGKPVRYAFAMSGDGSLVIFTRGGVVVNHFERQTEAFADIGISEVRELISIMGTTNGDIVIRDTAAYKPGGQQRPCRCDVIKPHPI